MCNVKKSLLICLVLSLLFAGWILPVSSFSQTTANISVNASVADTLDFTWNMYQLLGEQDPWSGTPGQTAMDFNNISELDSLNYPGRMFTGTWYCVFLWTNVTTPYHIKQTSESLYNRDTQNPAHNLNNSFVVFPDYNANDKWAGLWPQGALKSGEKVGSPSLVKNADILFSGTASHILRIYYSVPAQSSVSGWQPISTSQVAGNYRGSVTITITPQAP